MRRGAAVGIGWRLVHRVYTCAYFSVRKVVQQSEIFRGEHAHNVPQCSHFAEW